ncbi:hypothetical protein [Pasteurella multocida]|uniref:hypothetical protein n=1 Tax=Pasteurella multocida TaxID=747 RepID=UPI002162E191|nr:hypothetical protein [Pasteurella multocida]
MESIIHFGYFVYSKMWVTDREHRRDSAERYQTARAKLDTAVAARREQFSRKYPNRAGEIDKKYRENVSFAEPNRLDDISLDSHISR